MSVNAERTLKISQHLEKLWARVCSGTDLTRRGECCWPGFFHRSVCSVCT